jgi:hypothetical protein
MMRERVFNGCPSRCLTKFNNWRQCGLEPVTLRVPKTAFSEVLLVNAEMGAHNDTNDSNLCLVFPLLTY